MKLIYATRDSVPEDSVPEVQKITELHAGKPEIGLNLLFMGWNHPLNGFDFQKNHPLHNKIRTKAFIESSASVGNWNRHLTLHTKAVLL